MSGCRGVVVSWCRGVVVSWCRGVVALWCRRGATMLWWCGAVALRCRRGVVARVRYKTPGAPINARVDDLVSRMNMQEKVSHPSFFTGTSDRVRTAC